MKLKHILQEVLTEGVYDPGIFKAIFIAGGPGSGKGYVVNKLFGLNSLNKFSSQGIKLINSDIAFEKFLKNNNIKTSELDSIFQTDRDTYDKVIDPGREGAKKTTDYMQNKFTENRLGILIDGTGKNADKINAQKKILEDIGYDCYLIFVNTSLDIAKQRNKQRDRVVPEPVVVKSWQEVQNNLGKFQSMFSNKMTIVDNNDSTPIDANVHKTINKFLTSPPQNPIALQWISRELKNKNRASNNK
jgi:predicted kinase